MNDFNIGDKVIIKKLSEEEFKEVYHKKYNGDMLYNSYLNIHKNYFNQIYKIEEIYIDNSRIYFKDCPFSFFKEEVEKVNYLKTKYKIVNKLLEEK